MSTRWERIAREAAGEDYAREYAARFRALAARGEDVHGEAAFVAELVPAPARVLDAGCGTGRIAVRLSELGYDVVGVDVDLAMLWVAAGDNPELEWQWADLSTLELESTFDVVLVAGNTIPLLEDGTLADTCTRLAAHTEPGGLVICGFGLDEAHLPAGCPVTTLTDFQAAMALAGLDDVAEFSGWERGEFDPEGGYVVSVYQRPEA
ncbi:class I SAM-dependent methyltransferase [Nocardioides caricicola]|uniref:Class I SAM-dependent methyltransferase n=1 Tax=Nocardioides caricicola TaxID=634770 RepID=A0ABW0N2T9_9ACTN